MSSNKKVVVAISGGVDSSVAALLLKQQGYEVIGVTGKMQDDENSNLVAQKAAALAQKLGIEHHVLDLSVDFQKCVIDYFDETYKKAHTPNPCIACNNNIKWGKIFDWAMNEINADFYATGHYAKIMQKNGKYLLYPTKDRAKDQIYYLFELTQEQLAKTLFPLADYTKDEIKNIADENNLVEKNTYKESQDVCFIDKKMTTQRYLADKFGKIRGDFVEINSGKKLGEHNGYYRYTIGQRKGIGIAYTEPLYVVDIDAAKNTVYLGIRGDLFKKSMVIQNPVMHDCEGVKEFDALVKIRNNMYMQEAHITQANQSLTISFKEPASAITKGQATVLYDISDGHLIGGGWIN